ncbi:MAG: integrase core domain-containing protein [Planctomycetes bacterium]|nr:integrase core domain-containing protein [Planctomycetota bacterium]
MGLWSTLYVWFVLDLGTRRVLHWNVTCAPTDDWLAHQARAVTDFAQGPRYLIRDRDGTFGPRFDAVFEGCGTKIVKTPPRTPVANAFAERFVGSTRRELLAHLIVLSEDHLRIHMARWVAHYNGQRPHQGLGQRIAPREGSDPLRSGHGRAVAPRRARRRVAPRQPPFSRRAPIARARRSVRAVCASGSRERGRVFRAVQPRHDAPLAGSRGDGARGPWLRSATRPCTCSCNWGRAGCTISCGSPHTPQVSRAIARAV